MLLCVCVVSWVGGGGPALGGTVEWLRGGARGACRQVCVVGVAARGLSLYVGGGHGTRRTLGGLGLAGCRECCPVRYVFLCLMSYICNFGEIG